MFDWRGGKNSPHPALFVTLCLYTGSPWALLCLLWVKVGLPAPIAVTWRAFPLLPSKAPNEKDNVTSAEMLEMK